MPESTAERLAQVVCGRPPQVMAARALARLAVDDPLVSARKTLDSALHVGGVSTSASNRSVPLARDRTRGPAERSVSGCSEQIVPPAELHPRSSEGFSHRAFGSVDGVPALVRHDLHTTFDEQAVDPLGRAAGQPTRARILEQELDGLRRVLLVRPDDAARSALDPACAVHAGQCLATRLLEHPPTVVRDRPATFVEGHAGEFHAPVADAAEDDAARDHLELLGRLGANAPVCAGDEPVADDLDRLDLAVTVDRDGRDAEAELDRARLSGGLTSGVLAED